MRKVIKQEKYANQQYIAEGEWSYWPLAANAKKRYDGSRVRAFRRTVGAPSASLATAIVDKYSFQSVCVIVSL
jgi:hypothetical protein